MIEEKRLGVRNDNNKRRWFGFSWLGSSDGSELEKGDRGGIWGGGEGQKGKVL